MAKFACLIDSSHLSPPALSRRFRSANYRSTLTCNTEEIDCDCQRGPLRFWQGHDDEGEWDVDAQLLLIGLVEKLTERKIDRRRRRRRERRRRRAQTVLLYILRGTLSSRLESSVSRARERTMIGTLSNALATTCSLSNERSVLSPISPTRRFTFNSLATRLSDSKKQLLNQIPRHQQQLTRFRKRAKSFLSSTFHETTLDEDSPSSNRPHSSPEVYWSHPFLSRDKYRERKERSFFLVDV